MKDFGAVSKMWKCWVQVGSLGANYDDWVHQPVTRKECPRFFESNVLEVRLCFYF